MKKGYGRIKEREFIWKTNNGEIDTYCVFERRKIKHWDNYGEIIGTHNSADGDPWDACAFGYPGRFKIGIQYRVLRYLGELKLPNGNHKLIVEIDSNDAGIISPKKFKKDLLLYLKQYEKSKGWKPGSIKIFKFYSEF
jgi:inorganic pyrophosphatase